MVSRPEGWLPDIPSTYWWPCILIQQFLHTLSPIPPSLNHFPPTFFHLHLSHNLLLLHPAWILAFALQPPDVLTLHASIGVFHKYSTARVVNIAIRLNLFASAHVHPLPAPALLVSLKGLSSAHYFFLYTLHPSPISTIAHSHKVCQQQYADDMQLYVALSPVNYNHDISTLQSCPTSLQAWFCESSMALNPSKSVAILFGTPQRLNTSL